MVISCLLRWDAACLYKSRGTFVTLVRRIPDRPLIPEKDVHLVSDRGFRALRFLREASIVEGLGALVVAC